MLIKTFLFWSRDNNMHAIVHQRNYFTNPELISSPMTQLINFEDWEMVWWSLNQMVWSRIKVKMTRYLFQMLPFARGSRRTVCSWWHVNALTYIFVQELRMLIIIVKFVRRHNCVHYFGIVAGCCRHCWTGVGLLALRRCKTIQIRTYKHKKKHSNRI